MASFIRGLKTSKHRNRVSAGVFITSASFADKNRKTEGQRKRDVVVLLGGSSWQPENDSLSRGEHSFSGPLSPPARGDGLSANRHHRRGRTRETMGPPRASQCHCPPRFTRAAIHLARARYASAEDTGVIRQAGVRLGGASSDELYTCASNLVLSNALQSAPGGAWLLEKATTFRFG